jgi:biopolymer transport protein ExbB
MKKAGAWILAIFLISFAFPAAASEAPGWKELAAKIEAESRESSRQAAYTRQLIRKDKQELKQELEKLRSDLARHKESLSSKKEAFQSLLDEEQSLQSDIEAEKEEIKQVEDTVSNAAQRTRSLLEKSPVTAEHPQRMKLLHPLTAQEAFPGMQGIRNLTDMLQTEMRASGEVKASAGKFVGPKGREQSSTVLRIGSLTAAYRLPEKGAGYLQMGPDQELKAVAADLPWLVERSLESYIAGRSDHVPVDISGGTVFQRMTQSRDLIGWIRSGGLLVWPIFFVGGLALLLALERFLFLMRIRTNSDRIMERIIQLVQADKWQECRDFCARNHRFPTCRVLGQVMEHLGATRETLENAIQEAILRQVPRLERFVPTLSILGAIAPLLGLLGTVTGMINTFQVITLFGTGDPKLMSGGISEALVTTQLGLAVAIPIMLLHHFLERRVDKILADIEEKGNRFTLTLLKQGVIREEKE